MISSQGQACSVGYLIGGGGTGISFVSSIACIFVIAIWCMFVISSSWGSGFKSSLPSHPCFACRRALEKHNVFCLQRLLVDHKPPKQGGRSSGSMWAQKTKLFLNVIEDTWS